MKLKEQCWHLLDAKLQFNCCLAQPFSALVTVKTTPSVAAHLKLKLLKLFTTILRDQLARSPLKIPSFHPLQNEQMSRL